MIEYLASLTVYSLVMWFVFFLFNYAEITSRPSNWLKSILGPKLGYPLSCPACLTWWITLAGYIIYPDWSFWTCFAAPVIVLFIDLAYQKLSGNCPPCLGGSK